jgi:hypothetical protein
MLRPGIITNVAAIFAGGGGGGGGGFEPDDLASLRVWYKMDELSGGDGDAIATVPDASGLANDATQPTGGQRPSLELAEIGGLNAIRFDPANSEQLLLPTSYFTTWSAASLLSVIRCVGDPDATTGSPFFLGSSSDFNHYPWTNSTVYDGNFSTVRKDTGNPSFTLTNAHILGIDSGAANYTMRHNGITHYNTGTNTYGSGTVNYPRMGNGGSPWNGYMGEVVICEGVLSDSDREKVEGYLAHKWGLEGNLDAGHPYKAAPP